MIPAGLPIVLVILDGLGDRPLPALGDRTPAEAAPTPNLDALAVGGVNGIHLPFGWGRAPSSEVAHWALFGYSEVPFCGRAVLEALGADRPVPAGVPLFYAGLRPTGDDLCLGPYAGDEDADDARELFGALTTDGLRLEHLRRGEAILYAHELESAAVTDTEPLRVGEPWMRPQALAGTGAEAARSAAALDALMAAAHARLAEHPVNRRRAAPLVALTTKWGGRLGDVPRFDRLVGLRGAAVTSSGLYRGLARLLGLAERTVSDPDLAVEIDGRLALAEELLADGAEFVHVHTKATDEAGHTKQPHAKADVLAALDGGLGRLLDLRERAVVCVTGDHATPSSGVLTHSGDPTPLTVAGPTVRADRVRSFGECHAADGALGIVRAADVLPLLCGHADRARLMGHRPSPHDTVAQPRAVDQRSPESRW